MGKKQKKRQESDLDEVLLGVPPLRGVNKTDPEYNALPPIDCRGRSGGDADEVGEPRDLSFSGLSALFTNYSWNIPNFLIIFPGDVVFY